MTSTIAVYWLLPGRARWILLPSLTLLFLALADQVSALLLLVLTMGTYVAAKSGKTIRWTIPTAIASVIAILVFYKVRVSDAPEDVIRAAAMPLGLSYYCFRIIHYLIERSRGSLPPHGFVEYFGFLFFLPTLLVGPINRFREFVSDQRSVTWRSADLSYGAERMLFGYFKITVLASFLLAGVSNGVSSLGSEMKPLVLYLEAVCGSFNLYLLFSGYSDIAIGFARMLGFRIVENFNWPFLKTNVADFWRSWHMSLTSWSRDYVFMTVVGRTRNVMLGTLASLVTIGVWHELSARYVVWGLYHGLGIIAVNQFRMYRRHRQAPVAGHVPGAALGLFLKPLNIFITANWFFFGFIIIHSKTFKEMFETYYLILFSWWM